MPSGKVRDLVSESLKPSEREVYERKLTEARREAQYAGKEAADLKEQLSAAMKLGRPVITTIDSPPSGGEKADAVAILQASDWHVEELVDPKTIAGYNNKFNPEIAKRRAQNFFTVGHRLIDVVSQGLNLHTIGLALLGDFITNELHDESAENNSMPPTEAIAYAQDLIASGINFLLEENPRRNVVVFCKSGNHGRFTRRVHNAKEHGHSLEWLMYVNLAKFYQSEPRIKFDITPGYHTWWDVFGYKIRMHHGHDIQYQGGVGGITIPVNKAIGQWDKARQADLDLFGHFHTLLDGRKWAANGSLIGYNAYAVAVKAEPEPPAQWFHVIDSKRGRTYRAPLYVQQ